MTPTERMRLKNRIEASLLGTGEFRARVLRKNAAIAKEEGREEGREDGREEGKRQAHVAALLHILRDNDIRLSAPPRAGLKKRPSEQLPALGVASKAKSATDFMRRAGKKQDRY